MKMAKCLYSRSVYTSSTRFHTYAHANSILVRSYFDQDNEVATHLAGFPSRFFPSQGGAHTRTIDCGYSYGNIVVATETSRRD